MADDTVQIAIEAVDNASATLAKVGGSLDDLGETSQRASKQMASVEDAMIAIIRQEKAADAVALLSAQEKDAILAARDMVDAQNATAEAISKTGKSAQEGAQGFESFKGTIVAVQSGIQLAGEAISTVIGTLKQAWDFGKEGAAIERIGTQFNQVASDFGVSGDKLVAAMDKAAHGTVDDEELMQTATRALTQGVITNQDQLVKFTEIARASAVRFGGSTSQALQSILYATEVGAQRQLKATVGVVDFTKAYEDLAKQLGKRKQDLTDEEQLQARVNAVLSKGGELVNKVGANTEDTATKMERFETRVKDLGDRVHEVVANAFGPALDAGADYEKMLDQNASASDRLAAANRILESGWSSQNSALANQLLPSLKAAADAEAQQSKALAQMGQDSNEAARQQEYLRRAQHELSVEMLAVSQGARNQADTYAVLDKAMDGTAAKAALLASSQKMIADEMSLLKTAMAGALQNEFTNFGNKQDDLAAKAAKVKEELDKLQGSQGKVATGAKKHAMSAAEAALANLQLAKAEAELGKETAKGVLSAEQMAAAEEVVRLNKEKLQGVTKKQIADSGQLRAAQEALKGAQAQLASNTDPMKQAELAVKVEHLKESLNGASGAVVQYIDNSKRIKELQGQYDEINKEIEANVAEHEKATKTILFGYAEQQLAAGGFTETEAKALDALAVKWGLKSQEDVTAMQNIRTAAANLAKDGNIAEFAATVGINLDDVNAKYGETQGKVEGVGKAISAVDFMPPAQVKVDADTKPATQSVKGLADSLLHWQPLEVRIKFTTTEEAKGVAGDTLAERRAQFAKTAADDTSNTVKAISGAIGTAVSAVGTVVTQTTDKAKTAADVTEGRLNALAMNVTTKMTGAAGVVITAFSAMASLAIGDISGVITWVDKLPTYRELIYQVIVKGKNNIPGAQYGADFIVPANPRGGTGDYFPVMAAPGERVIVQTRAQQGAGESGAKGGDTYNYIYNNRITDTLAATMIMDQQRRDRVARSNARMGAR